MDDYAHMQEFGSPGDEMPGAPTRPCNIEAEQSLLGAVLSNNEVYQEAAKSVKPAHFYDPLHQFLFRLIGDRLGRNSIADPRTLKPFIDQEPGFGEIGGVNYLIKLQDTAISVHAARQYAEEIYQLAIRRNLIDLYGELTDIARSHQVDKSPADLIAEAEQRLYAIGDQGEGNIGFQSFVKAMTGAVEAATLAVNRKSGLSGLPTGFLDLDQKLGGLQDSDLVIIAGRPGMGKTALATNIAYNVAREYRSSGAEPNSGGRVGFFSLEMPSSQLAARILAASSRIPISRIRTGTIDNRDLENYTTAAKALQSCPIFIDDTAALPISQLAIRARRQKETQGLELLIVDYIQLVQSTNTRENKVYQVAEITQGLKAIAKELSIPVVALSQLSRSVEGRDIKKPQLSDLRDSGSIEQDADIVMFVYRKEYYLEQEKPDESDSAAIKKWEDKMNAAAGRAEILVTKHRQGPTGVVKLGYDKRFTQFANAAIDGYSDPVGEGRSVA